MDYSAQFRREASGELTLKEALAAGGDPSNHQLVLSESVLQFGQYHG